MDIVQTYYFIHYIELESILLEDVIKLNNGYLYIGSAEYSSGNDPLTTPLENTFLTIHEARAALRNIGLALNNQTGSLSP